MTLMQNNEQSRRIDAYPDNVNYALYELIWALGIVILCLSAAMFLISHP